MSSPLVVVDADVLGRHRTGDETYMRNLLRALAPLADDAGIRVAAVTRHPALVPEGIEPVELRTRSQELRMAWTLPRLLRRLGASLVHVQYALPLGIRIPTVVTIHDLSFERDPSSMKRRDRLVFRAVVPRAARRAGKVLVVSERTRRDLDELYGVRGARVALTPNAVDPAFSPGERPAGDEYLLSVGAIQERKGQLAAADAAAELGLPLVVVGPVKDEQVARELREHGARLTGYIDQDELVRLYRGAACLVQPSRYEGFGLPLLEAMACGTPVVASPDPALREVAGDAAVFAEDGDLVGAIRRALADRQRLVWAGLERSRLYSWEATAARTLDAYRELLGR